MAQSKDLTGLLTANGTQFAYFSFVVNVVPTFFARGQPWYAAEERYGREKYEPQWILQRVMFSFSFMRVLYTLLYREQIKIKSKEKNPLTTLFDFPFFFNLVRQPRILPPHPRQLDQALFMYRPIRRSPGPS